MVAGRPKGIDFLIHMFHVAAGVTLTDQNFIDPDTKAWTQQPWIGNPGEQRKSWCGIFCVEVGGGMAPSMTIIDGNKDYGRILRVWSSESKAHRVGKDNFNYYSLV